MGLPMDSDKYEQVLKACALMPDLQLLPAGDQTEIGEMLCCILSSVCVLFAVCLCCLYMLHVRLCMPVQPFHLPAGSLPVYVYLLSVFLSVCSFVHVLVCSYCDVAKGLLLGFCHAML